MSSEPFHARMRPGWSGREAMSSWERAEARRWDWGREESWRRESWDGGSDEGEGEVVEEEEEEAWEE